MGWGLIFMAEGCLEFMSSKSQSSNPQVLNLPLLAVGFVTDPQVELLTLHWTLTGIKRGRLSRVF